MNTAYQLIPVTIIAFAAYFTTRAFAAWEIVTLHWHRKLWNYILLISFLVSGLLGLLAVIKVNYKLEIPHYNAYLQWHVDLGIAMVFIAIFHLSWHLRYYLTFRKTSLKKKDQPAISAAAGSVYFPHLLLLLGMIAIINQVLFIREFITVLSGNELVVGTVLSAWMLLTGLGALAGRKGNFSGLNIRRAMAMLVTITLYPMLAVALLYLLKNLLFPPGMLVGINSTLLAAVLLLFPVCFLSGYLFTALSTVISFSGKTNLAGRSYSLESVGSLGGGLLFTFILGRFFNTLEVLGITAAIILLAGAWLLRSAGVRGFYNMLTAGIMVPVLVFIFNPDIHIKKSFYPNQEIVASKSTRLGNIVVTSQAGQVNVYENNELLFYTNNMMVNEESVHFAMVQHPEPRQVLLLSGVVAGMPAEILKYQIDRVTCLEANPEILNIPGRFTDSLPGGEELMIVRKDIRSFIAETNEKYDVILINLPAPSSLGINRFNTAEFFGLIKKHCKPGAVISTSLPSTANYADENALDANASLWKTLGLFFKNRMLFTGEKNYFVASDAWISPDITKLISARKVSTQYVNSFYVDDKLLQMRSRELISRFSDTVPVNRDFNPFIYTREISHWLSYFKTPYHLLVIVPILLFLLLFLRTNRITSGLYTGGFTAASLQLVLLLAYQVFFGSIYLASALFFAVFMAGLALGSSGKIRFNMPGIKIYYLLQFFLALFAIVLPLLINLAGSMDGLPLARRTLFFTMILVLSAAVGLEFNLACQLQKESYSEITGNNYGTDLAGSALGAFLAAVVLLPLLGLIYTCLAVAVLNLFSGLMAFTAQKVRYA